MSTWGDLISDALIECGAYMPGEPVRPEDYQLAVRKLDRLLDQMAGLKRFCYTTAFVEYTLTANHAPHLIGPDLTAPDFATPNGQARPPRIESAALVLTDAAEPVDVPMNIRDRKWWAEKRVKTLASNVPTDLFYDESFPNGALNFWPIPDFDYDVRLEIWTPVGAVPKLANGQPKLTAAFAAPQGYEALLFEELVVGSCTAYGRAVTPEMRERLRRARAAVQSNNLASPRTESVDWGTRGRQPSGFNYYSGLPTVS